jgi:hypothetical protein
MDQAMGTTISYERDEEERHMLFEHPANSWELQRLRFLAQIAALDNEGYREHPGNVWELQRLRRLAELAANEKDYWEHPASDWELQRLRRLAQIAAREEDYQRSNEERCPLGTQPMRHPKTYDFVAHRSSNTP